MNFYNYMMRNYLHTTGPKADLAHDMSWDKENFPRNRNCKYDGGHKLIFKYLMDQGACYDCLDVFEDCWKEYVQYERKNR